MADGERAWGRHDSASVPASDRLPTPDRLQSEWAGPETGAGAGISTPIKPPGFEA